MIVAVPGGHRFFCVSGVGFFNVWLSGINGLVVKWLWTGVVLFSFFLSLNNSLFSDGRNNGRHRV